MADYTAIRQAALAYMHTPRDDESWPEVESNFHVIAADPRTILALVDAVHVQDAQPTAEELQAIAKLVRDLVGYIKLMAGDKQDSVKDDLLLQARQLLGLAGL